MSPDPIVHVRGLTKVYRGGRRAAATPALDGLDLSVTAGSVFGLLGPNGAGKTTLIKVLLGLVPRWKGEARMFGRDVGESAARSRVGYLPEAHRFPTYLTGRQVLLLYGMLSGKSAGWLRSKTDHWLKRLNILDAADTKVREYSKGMQQRLGLAQALIHEPELVFLDEPTDGVDPVGRAVIREIVEDLRASGTTVFINSHLLMEVEQICDRVVILSKGKLLREGTVSDLTPKTGLVSIEADPLPDDLEEVLAGVGTGFSRNERGFVISADNEALDEVVDRLRARGISIRTISPRRLTLEESFIESITGEER